MLIVTESEDEEVLINCGLKLRLVGLRVMAPAAPPVPLKATVNCPLATLA